MFAKVPGRVVMVRAVDDDDVGVVVKVVVVGLLVADWRHACQAGRMV